MKTLKCDMCDHIGEGETFEAWMGALKPHYADKHADFMTSKGEMSHEEQQAEMMKWMQENKKRFEDEATDL